MSRRSALLSTAGCARSTWRIRRRSFWGASTPFARTVWRRRTCADSPPRANSTQKSFVQSAAASPPALCSPKTISSKSRSNKGGLVNKRKNTEKIVYSPPSIVWYSIVWSVMFLDLAIYFLINSFISKFLC